MFIKSIKTTLSAVAILSSLGSLGHAGKNEILQFSSSTADEGTGKVIMKMIRKSNPSYFRGNAEHLRNQQGKLAYTLTSNGIGQGSAAPAKFRFEFTSVEFVKGKLTKVSTSPQLQGNGYNMTLQLDMSGKLLTEKGRNFFTKRAREQSGVIRK
ncbi:MAG TPA: hypothetical protein VMW10_05450 [Alphaproteobacteria bacterium]|nr:hypothetical protein [Alphaproteobacteria bacterium]